MMQIANVLARFFCESNWSPLSPAPLPRPGERGSLTLTGLALLFLLGISGVAGAAEETTVQLPAKTGSNAKWKGFVQSEVAYTMPSPAHGSKFNNQLELEGTGSFNENVKWKLGAAANYNAIYDLNNFYPDAVRDDQRAAVVARENYLDISTGNLDFRLGRQHIIWGEVVGFFVADVVSAKDMREFLLPEFELLRIPQWTARAEYFKGDFHAEAIWVPVMSYDNIGKPGAEFYPYPPAAPAGYGYAIQNEKKPTRNLGNSAYGARLSYLLDGWDSSVFFYRSVDAAPTFYREVVSAPTPAFVYTPQHDKIRQYGLSVSKEVSDTVLKLEAVLTQDRNYNVSRLDDADGVVRQNTFDYVIGADFTLPRDTRLNAQFYQRVYQGHDADIIPEARESGVTLLLNTKLGQNWEPEILIVRSLNRAESMIRPKVKWRFAKDWRLAVGADWFSGPATGFFGQYRNKDRVYAEVRRNF